MTEPRNMEPFEARFAGRVRDYTDRATERRIDALAMSRTAMSSQRATVWLGRRLGGRLLDPIAGVPWALAALGVVLISVIAAAVLGRQASFSIGPNSTAITSTPGLAVSPGGPVPDALRHSWQRPYAVTPGLDSWGTGFLTLTSGVMDFGPAPGPEASRSAITAAGPAALVVTATAETQRCAIGDIGRYGWTLEGQATVMTLVAINADACSSREEALAGSWVRSDLPRIEEGEPTLPPGTYRTAAFNPLDRTGVSGQLSFTVAEGWKVKIDEPASFLLHHLPISSARQPGADVFISLFARPRLAADFVEGETCGRYSEAPGVGHGVDDLVSAILARPGVVSTPPTAVTIGGYEGRMLDLHLAPSWTGACIAPEGPIVGMAILVEAGAVMGPAAGIGPDHAFRLILLDLTKGRTMAVVVFSGEPDTSPFEEQIAEAMPIIESFEFHPPTP
jgi:hypothetical protein